MIDQEGKKNIDILLKDDDKKFGNISSLGTLKNCDLIASPRLLGAKWNEKGKSKGF